ncbi:hypothetical protein CLF_106845 [Clonorchis sinensis]|uniref:Uncharacterized protein n=1 Tax=Clonorchis sinensis TaxID=79923 RepID=G7YFU8_CLOSI|nr:hypothetical protein CLF_106845 [Clonorchis sinensis]
MPPLAAKKVIQLSNAAIKTATASLVDRRPLVPLKARRGKRPRLRTAVSTQPPQTPPNSKGSDAPEEASLTWTERPKYVEISALLSVTDDKGATVNSKFKSQPSWIGSDERSQVTKPTGKPTTCADVDIGECCQNRTSTEAVKLPISSSTPSKAASLIVDTTLAQDHDNQSHKPDHGDRARNPEPQTWIRNFCRADFSGMRIFLNQVKLGPASVEDLYRTIVQKVHEADAMYVPKKPARSRTSRKLPKRIRRLLEKRSQLFLKKLTTGDTEDELAFRKMRNRCKSEIRQWNIRKQATILDLARKNRNVLFKYMRHRRRNKPSAFSLRDRNGEPTSDPIVVSEFYRDHYAEIGSEGIRCSTDDSAHLLRITRTDFQILYGAYVRPLLEYANPVVYSGRTKDVIIIEGVQRAATKLVAGLKSMDYGTRPAVLDAFPLEYRRLRGDLILTYALSEQGLANRFFTVDPANTRRGHGERQRLNDKNKTDPGNLGESLDPVYQSLNP